MISLVRFKSTYLILVFCTPFCWMSCAQQTVKKSNKIETGADQTSLYIHQLKGRKIAIVANQTSVILKKSRSKKQMTTHLVDSLLALGVTIQKVFAPEHGFRGKLDAGEIVKDGIDSRTRLSIVSLYGKNKKPSNKHLKGIELIVFDIQDVGVRFYTYISSLHYVMEAAAENGIPVLLLDRPNPNGHYIDGPVLELAHKSFVGMHPVPVVYGMTIGEYGKMINGEKWLKNSIQCDLTVIPLKNYKHTSTYSLPIKPSPNLPNDKAINLYPSLCFFEGTNVSAGRGTSFQFQLYGSPFLNNNGFSFTPEANEGAAHPKHKNKISYGEDLRSYKNVAQIELSWLLKAYRQNTAKEFFNSFFTKLSGTKKLQEQIEQGTSERNIRKSWQKDLNAFKKIRKKYLIY